MTPERLCEWILDGRIYDLHPSGGATSEEMGRDVWPARMETIVQWAKDASQPDDSADNECALGQECSENEIECQPDCQYRR